MSASQVLTREQRDAMTPEEVVDSLMDGNKRFVAGELTQRDYRAQVKDAAEGQSPKAVVLSCLDSRIPVEDVFDCGIGDVFVARVAGNFENIDILGSMEFACLTQHIGGGGAKAVFVLGHEGCGAVKHAVDQTEAGNISAMLENLQPAVEATECEGDRVSTNADFVRDVAKTNVLLTLGRIRERSEIIRRLEDDSIIKLVGGFYSLSTGEVTLLEEETEGSDA